MKLKTIIGNAIFAALYVAVSAVIAPFGFEAVQFRVSEIFNHLVVFNRKYIFGIVLGVFLTNLFFSPLKAYDLTFGVGHSLITLLILIGAMKFIKGTWARLLFNTGLFTFTMFIIAYMLKLAYGVPFLFGWLTTAAGEFVVMLIGAPIMYALNKRLRFGERV